MAAKGRQLKGSDLATIACGVLGIGIWWFLSSNPSDNALFLAGTALTYIFLIYCLLAFFFPGSKTAPHSDDPEATQKSGQEAVSKKVQP